MDDPIMDDMGDDGIICRVCRTEAEPDHPLFHPCKCSGSIRYVHSDCLLQWLNHSKKQYCELCGHAFSFQKVYPADIPDSLPLHSLIKRLLLDVTGLITLALRAVLVAFTWLVLLPLVMFGAWRSYFQYGAPLAMMVTGITPSDTVTNVTAVAATAPGNVTDYPLSWWQIFYRHITVNQTAHSVKDIDPTTLANTTVTIRILTALKPTNYVPSRQIIQIIWRKFTASDIPERIFRGQILTIGIVIALLAVFLLREWIFQNAGPGPNQEVENEPVPRPEDFQLQMRATWRQRRLRHLDRDDTVDMLLNGDFARNPANIRAALLRPRPPLDRQQQDLLRAELIEHFVGQQEEPEDAGIEEDQWVDEEDWADKTANADDLPDDDVSNPSEYPRIDAATRNRQTDTSEAYSNDGQADTFAHEGPVPSLLQQLRQQHREHADPNMSFEEFLAHSGSDIIGASGSGASLRPPPSPQRCEEVDENVQSHTFSRTAARQGSFGDRSRDRAQPFSSRNDDTQTPEETPGAQESMDDEYLRYFTEPNVAEDGYEELIERRRGAGMDRERLPRALRDGAGLPEAIQRNPRPRRPRDILNDVDLVRAAIDRDEEVEMGPEPDLDDEEADEGGLMIDGDLDGILEAIGMRGPPAALFQNFLLICVVLNCVICIIVNVPFVIGKIHLIADIGFVGRLIRLPIMVTRLITDPVIDGLVALGKITLRQLPSWMMFGISGKAGLSVGANEVAKASTRSYWNSIIPIVDHWRSQAIDTLQATFGATVFGSLALLFGNIGRTYRTFSSKITSFALQDTAYSRAAAISLGLFDIDMVLLIIAALGEQYLGSFGKVVTEHVDQNSVILKLGFFMSVELLLFPLSMGYFLDFCTLPLFPSGTLRYRWIAQCRNPALTAFVHWLAGTMFMFAFAKFLSTCRSICRKGAMYVIRDPQDPSFSPVREILDKKTSVQIYKLLVSASMYMSVMAIPLGGILSLLKYSGLSILPLRWSFRDSLSTAPLDLLLLLLWFPESFRQVKWQDQFKAITRFCFKILSETLRLSSYFRGIKIVEEEQPGKLEMQLLHLHRRFSNMLSKVTKREVDDNFYEGTYMRVPYADQVILLKPRKNVFIPVDHMGIPKKDADKVLWLMQDRAAVKGHRDPRKDYCMVYLPPFYRLRFWVFGLSLWSFISWTIVFALIIPILVGRTATHHFIGREVHDGINLLAGYYTCLIASRLGKRAGKRVASHVRRYLDTPRYRTPFSWKRYIVKEGDRVLKFARYTCTAFLLYVVSPVLIGLCLELYIFAPINYGKSDITPVFHVTEAWCTGIVIMALCFLRSQLRIPILKIFMPFLGELDIAPDHEPEMNLDVQLRIVSYASRPGIVHRVLAPVLKYLGLAILAPGVTAAVLAVVLKLDSRQSAILYRFIHPFLLYSVLLRQVLIVVRGKAQEWSVNALESEYLVEQRVINLEDAEAAGGHDVKVFDPRLHAADVHHE